MKCKMGELPYGWDEEIDPEIGVYYVDHNTQSTFIDPPWDPRIQFQVSQLSRFLADQISIYKKKLTDIETEKEIEREDKKSEIGKIKKEKEKLQKELEALRKKISSESESEIESEYEVAPKTVEEFQDRLRELMNLQEKLRSGERVDEVADFKQTKEEIAKVQQMLEEEERNRMKILDEIEKLKGEITSAITENGSSPDSQYSDIPRSRSDAADHKPKLTRKTRYEMEVELIMLRKKLMADRQTVQRLKKIQEKVTDTEGALPQWVKKMEEVASSSKTLRVKITQKQASGPDALSFRERMLFFAAKGADANAPSKFLPPPVKKR